MTQNSKFKTRKGLVFIISAPSGAGKTTIRSRLLKRIPGIAFSISYTTRSLRKGEKNGIDYNFVTKAEFQKLIRSRRLLEWAEVHGEFYGTEHKSLLKTINSGKDILVEVDFQGASRIKQLYPDSVSIFILARSMIELKKRLEKRGTEESSSLSARLERARLEMAQAKDYDYLVMNTEIRQAVRQVEAIITAEHCRKTRIWKRTLAPRHLPGR